MALVLQVHYLEDHILNSQSAALLVVTSML